MWRQLPKLDRVRLTLVRCQPGRPGCDLELPDSIRSHEVKDFHKQFPQASVYMNTSMPSTIAGTVELIKNNPGAYDAALGDLPTLGQMKAAGVYQTPDWSAMPNLSHVDATYRRDYPDAVPNDYGFGVIGYRKDIVTEPVTSWADFWKLAATIQRQGDAEDPNAPRSASRSSTWATRPIPRVPPSSIRQPKR